MGKVFSGCEVVELAVQIEKNGVEFYKELASKKGVFRDMVEKTQLELELNNLTQQLIKMI